VRRKKIGFILLTVIYMIVAGVAFAAQNQTPGLHNPNVNQVSPRVFALVGDMDVPNETNTGFICNSVFIVTDTSVVVVDPGGSLQVGRMILEQIRKVSDKPVSHVFNTHHHADHWMGNHAFAELSPPPKLLGHAYMLDTAAEIGERWLKIIADMTKGGNKGTKVVLPTTALQGGETFTVGGVEIKVLHPPHAHTQGDLILHLPQEKILIAGDVLFYLRTPGFQDASPLGNARALDELINLDVMHVIPGHGPVTDKQGIQYMRNYLTLLQQQVEKFFEQGLADYEMKDKIDVGQYRSMSGFKERFGINVNRMFLEVEKQEFQ